MASIDNHILTITEPTIKLDKVEFASMGEGEGNDKANLSKGLNLVISINRYMFNMENIKSMLVDCMGILPTIDLVLIDTNGQFSVDTFPRDGDVINLRIGSLDKKTYKDIRMDFDIVNVETPLQGADVKGGKYIFTGRLKVPGLYSEDCKSYGKGTSLDHIESIANDLKLGVATNIDSADDEMNLVIPFNSMYDTLEDLVRHSYIDEDSFQTFSIDQYYYVNYVNLNKLFDSEETLEDAILAYGPDFTDMPSANIKDDAINQAKLPLVFSNHMRDQGTNRFISSQSLKNRSGASAKKNGYKRVLQYYENDSEEGLVSHDIEPLASKNMKDIDEPMKGRRDEDRYKNEIKYKYVGRKSGDPETSNVHLNYEYAAIANAQNIDEVRKMSLDIELPTFNPAIHKYHKIPVFIYNNDNDRLLAEKQINEAKDKSGFENKKVEDSNIGNPGVYIIDEFLSGYYIVGGIQYIYKSGNASVSQKVNLLRREWPSRMNNINKETVSAPAAKAVETPPTTPIVPPPAPEPPAPTPDPIKEPVLDLNLDSFKYVDKLGSWYEFKPKFKWTADDKSLVTEVPKIKIKFIGSLEKEFDAVAAMEDQGDTWDSYNVSSVIPKATFKDKEGKYKIKVTLTYKDQTVEKEADFKWNPWKTDSIIKESAITSSESRKIYIWSVQYGPEYGIFTGSYTLSADAKKNNSSPPKNGKIEGENLNDILKQTEEANSSELMKG
jgi:hypothetical protein